MFLKPMDPEVRLLEAIEGRCESVVCGCHGDLTEGLTKTM